MTNPKTIISSLLLACIHCSTWAQPSSENTDEVFFKLTPTFLANSDKTGGTDINLRANAGPIITWIGYYEDTEHFKQVRAGYEYAIGARLGHITPSVQVASKGFTGLSVNHQMGDKVYSILGLSRTNMRDYYNLSFDPIESVSIGIGTKYFKKTNLFYYTVKDNGLNTGETVSHVVWQLSPEKGERWIVD
ncbi:MAG: hypothetical protein EXR35_04860 [Limnohabitans sp.]|nr:hypothetical protein [Limnohabitans sp.]